MAEPLSNVHQRFGANLKKLRKSAKLSQEQLANEAGLDRTYISLLERGLRNPTLECMASLALALGVDLHVVCKW